MNVDVKRNSLAEWLEYLEQLHPRTIEMGLERVNRVRFELGLIPSFPVIIVGGTNGKGSVCVFLESLLTAAGYHVGCYTSPHLIRYNERIRIRQKAIDDQQICQAFLHVDQARKNCNTSLTYFEFGTLAAMYLFVDQAVDVAILEVGLGGRMDAVNIFDADCAILNTIDFDHMDYLGDTRERIGYEKAGIFRRGKPAVCAEKDLPLSVRQYAEKIDARLLRIDQDFGFTQKCDNWNFWSRKGWRHTLPLPALYGDNQLRNASTSLMALEMLSDQLPVSMQAIRTGLLTVNLPGRFQILSNQPMIILDVAHNPSAARTLARNLKVTRTPGKTFAVFAMLQDKDISGVIQELKSQIDIWLLSPIHAFRGASTQALMDNLNSMGISRQNHTIFEFADTVSAYIFACEQSGKDDRICVFGSFYTAAAVLRYQERENCQ